MLSMVWSVRIYKQNTSTEWQRPQLQMASSIISMGRMPIRLGMTSIITIVVTLPSYSTPSCSFRSSTLCVAAELRTKLTFSPIFAPANCSGSSSALLLFCKRWLSLSWASFSNFTSTEDSTWFNGCLASDLEPWLSQWVYFWECYPSGNIRTITIRFI